MAKQDYSDKLKGFKEKVTSETVTAPMQKLVPLTATKGRATLDREKEKAFNVWLSNDTIMALKIKAATEGKTLKELINIAINDYLDK